VELIPSLTAYDLLGIPESAVVRGSQRALHERIAVMAHGTSYTKALGDARFELPKQLMKNIAMPLHQISARLGYSEISAFPRAFTRWTGKFPSAWRLQSQLQSVRSLDAVESLSHISPTSSGRVSMRDACGDDP
jgi:AraC-like DNA-binding protein